MEKEIKTHDLNLAATLILMKNELMDMVKDESGRATFVINANEKTVEDYWNNGIRVEPKAFSQKVRELKARIYETT